MKSALNGGLNLSIRDGWWDELYDGRNGWAIPTADGIDDPHRRDDLEANALYELLGTQVAPAFYDRADGVPQRWVALVRHTLADAAARRCRPRGWCGSTPTGCTRPRRARPRRSRPTASRGPRRSPSSGRGWPRRGRASR